jgi:AraC-like DNA-binding protein
MIDRSELTNDQNLCQRPDARASCSVMASIGDGLQDLQYILRCDRPWEDGLWCDTYDGLNESLQDWWAVHWSEPLACNVIQFWHGPMTDSGGWWRTLHVEYQPQPDAPWIKATGLTISPAYDFDDHRASRMPYSLFTLTFARVRCQGIRLAGKPGGLAQHTKIARMAVFNHDLRYWFPPASVPPKKPRLLRLLPPSEVFRLLVRFYPVCEILFTLMIGRLNLIYFLEQNEYDEWKTISRFAADPTDFWRRVYDREGARRWYAHTNQLVEQARQTHRPVTGVRPDGLAQVVAPLILDGQVVGILRNTSLVRIEPFDGPDRKTYIQELGLNQDLYLQELARIPGLTRNKLEAIGAFLESIANTLRDLAYRNELLEQTHPRAAFERTNPAEIARQAIIIMRQRLEEPLTIREIAVALALSPGHFARLFHQETGRSPRDYLIDLRLERACYLLRSGKVSVAEACVASGYQSLPSFTRLFHQRLGQTPTEYARALTNQAKSGG